MTDNWHAYRQRVDEQLESHLADASIPATLASAMRYGIFNGGKRIRPLLVYLTAEALGTELALTDSTACAIEMIHAYSLIHDDLPAMDDDDLRRGKPTCHIAFDEATAILAGDALQAMAFKVVADDDQLTAAIRIQLVSLLASAAGAIGMVGGQMIDLGNENPVDSIADLEQMHHRKTGELIAAAVKAAGIIGESSPEQLTSLETFGFALGLAFQIRDDILDVTGSEDSIGKPVGSDEAADKRTFMSMGNVEAAEARLARLADEAEGALSELGNPPLLGQLTHFVITRDH